MAKNYRSERFIPIGTSRRSFLEPSWEVEPWDARSEWPMLNYGSYSSPMRNLDHYFSDLQREMEQRMAEMRSRMFTLLPSESYMKSGSGLGSSLGTGSTLGAGSAFTKIDKPTMIEKDGKNVMELKFDVQQFKP